MDAGRGWGIFPAAGSEIATYKNYFCNANCIRCDLGPENGQLLRCNSEIISCQHQHGSSCLCLEPEA